jgi:hypothetical protein
MAGVEVIQQLTALQLRRRPSHKKETQAAAEEEAQ